MKLFLGWDVGAWNCDGGASQDAICPLVGTSFDDLKLASEPLRLNLREALVTRDCPNALLSVFRPNLPLVEEAVIAIDTPLGWPLAFTSLLCGDTKPASVSAVVSENPYIFRRTEQALVSRHLFPKGRTPLSPVRDMIGSQSSKGLFYLQKSGMSQSSPSVWRTAGFTAIETYPTPVRTSRMLMPHFERLSADPRFVKRTMVGKNAAADLHDSLWCALVAATWEAASAVFVTAGTLCQISCGGAAAAGCGAVGIACAAGVVWTYGGISIPCKYAVVAACYAIGAAGVACANLCSGG